MAEPREGKGQIALGGRRTGPVAGCNLFAHIATADVATADVGKQAGNGLRRGTHGKPFPCTVCGLRGQKSYKSTNIGEPGAKTCLATSSPLKFDAIAGKSQVMAYPIDVG